MKAYEFPAQITADGNVKLPEQVRSHLGEQQTVKIILLINEPDDDCTAPSAQSKGKGYPPNFFEETFGCFKDEPLTVEDEGNYEEREVLL
ncbi:hypothetical protein [Egbenema bharatensis]|uniref:hypothetical protein n=1 Tax=Egbenema bharatensis TaxID=3463334 RepID=UPI003A8C2FCE